MVLSRDSEPVFLDTQTHTSGWGFCEAGKAPTPSNPRNPPVFPTIPPEEGI